MNNRSINEIEEIIGKEAVRQAQYNNNVTMAVAIVGIPGFGYILVAGKSLSQEVLYGWYLLLLVAIFYAVYSFVKLARLLRKKWKIKVQWYEIPPINNSLTFNRWLDKKLAQIDRQH